MAEVTCSRNSGVTVLKSAVSIEPGLMTFTRMPRSFSSAAQVRASERTAALLAEYTPAPGMPLVALVVPFRMIDAPSLINGSKP